MLSAGPAHRTGLLQHAGGCWKAATHTSHHHRNIRCSPNKNTAEIGVGRSSLEDLAELQLTCFTRETFHGCAEYPGDDFLLTLVE